MQGYRGDHRASRRSSDSLSGPVLRRATDSSDRPGHDRRRAPWIGVPTHHRPRGVQPPPPRCGHGAPASRGTCACFRRPPPGPRLRRRRDRARARHEVAERDRLGGRRERASPIAHGGQRRCERSDERDDCCAGGRPGSRAVRDDLVKPPDPDRQAAIARRAPGVASPTRTRRRGVPGRSEAPRCRFPTEVARRAGFFDASYDQSGWVPTACRHARMTAVAGGHRRGGSTAIRSRPPDGRFPVASTAPSRSHESALMT